MADFPLSPALPTPRRRGRPPGAKNKPKPQTPPHHAEAIPPRPAEISDEIAEYFRSVLGVRGKPAYVRAHRLDTLTNVLKYIILVYHNAAGDEIDHRRLRTVLREWGLPHDSRTIETRFLISAFADLAVARPGERERLRGQIVAEIRDPDRRRLVRTAEAVLTPPHGADHVRLRRALIAAAIVCVIRRFESTRVSRADIAAAIDYECAVAGLRMRQVDLPRSPSLLDDLIRVTVIRSGVYRIEGEQADIVERLREYIDVVPPSGVRELA